MYETPTHFPSSQPTHPHIHQPNSTTYGHQTSQARHSPDSAVRHVLSHNTLLMSSASRLTRCKNARFLKTFHCFIPARWTNQQAEGGALSSAGQVTKKVADDKGRVRTPTGHHPVSKRNAQKFVAVTAGHATGGEGGNKNYEQNYSCNIRIFIFMSIYSYCMFMYLHRASWHSSATLAEGFPCFFLSRKANGSVKPAKTGHGPHSSHIFVLFCVLFVLCPSVYCLCVMCIAMFLNLCETAAR